MRRAARATTGKYQTNTRPVGSGRRAAGLIGGTLCVGEGGSRERLNCEDETQYPEAGRDRPC
jgi:hypothetical protein